MHLLPPAPTADDSSSFDSWPVHLRLLCRESPIDPPTDRLHHGPAPTIHTDRAIHLCIGQYPDRSSHSPWPFFTALLHSPQSVTTTNERTNEPTNQRTYKQTNDKRMIDRPTDDGPTQTHKRTNKQTNKRANERTNERTNEDSKRTNERNERTNDRPMTDQRPTALHSLTHSSLTVHPQFTHSSFVRSFVHSLTVTLFPTVNALTHSLTPSLTHSANQPTSQPASANIDDTRTGSLTLHSRSTHAPLTHAPLTHSRSLTLTHTLFLARPYLPIYLSTFGITLFLPRHSHINMWSSSCRYITLWRDGGICEVFRCEDTYADGWV